MLNWLAILFGPGKSLLRSRKELALENLVLRQQLAVFKRRQPRPQLTDTDRLLWALVSKFWANWREALLIVQPDTVVRVGIGRVSATTGAGVAATEVVHKLTPRSGPSSTGFAELIPCGAHPGSMESS